MIDINWNNFKAKFNGRETKKFEEMSYHLFCSEFNINKGIFRFKNQIGIETEPIKVEADIIGFQAKYYDTKVSDNKEDIIDSIKKAKSKNPELTKVYVYLNKELSESSKKNVKSPKYKKDIEKEAQDINIEWRVPSHFERQLALPKNNYLAEYYFSLDDNIVDFLDEINNHTKNLLFAIRHGINCNEQVLKIDRTGLLEDIEKNSRNSQVTIITGDGGCGKTALTKEFYEKINGKMPLYVFKAAEFDISNIRDLFSKYGEYYLNDFIKIHDTEEEKFIVIDSAEKISDLDKPEAFKEFLSVLIKNSWKIIFTTRYSYLEYLKFHLIETYRIPFQVINIKNLSIEELKSLSLKYEFPLPANQRLEDLIKNLFYLDEYLQNYQGFDKKIDYNHFKNILWQKKIQDFSNQKDNIHIERENCFLDLVKIRCKTGSFFIKGKQCSNKALSKLREDEIIEYDSNQAAYFITHDIYEEWGLDKIIEREFNSSDSLHVLFEKIGTSLPIRRAFRYWLSENLIDNIGDIKPYIEDAFLSRNIDPFWKDELIIAILLSDYSETFFEHFEPNVLENNHSLLKEIVFQLRIACKVVDDDLQKITNSSKSFNFVFTKPRGVGWHTTIKFIYKNIAMFSTQNMIFLIPLLQEWNQNSHTGETTRFASLFALHFYKEIQFNEDLRYNSNLEKELIKIILYGAPTIIDELTIVFKEVLNNSWKTYNSPYYELCKIILTEKYDNFLLIKSLPGYVIKLADLFWYIQDENDRDDHYSRHNSDSLYSIDNNLDYLETEEKYLQTPIYFLLKMHFVETIDFILNFTNKTVVSYFKSKHSNSLEEVEVMINDKLIVKQFVDNGLWYMYCDRSYAPSILKSIHMALKKFLLEIANIQEKTVIESWLIYLMKNSKSASISSVVASVVMTYPEKFFNAAKILFNVKEFLFIDTGRMALDYNMNKDDDITCANMSLERLMLYYQFTKSKEVSQKEFKQRQKIIWDIIDGFYAYLSEKNVEKNKKIDFGLLLARIDYRKMTTKNIQYNGKTFIGFESEIDSGLRKHSEEALSAINERNKYLNLNMWAIHKSEKNIKCKECVKYDENPEIILKETKEIVDTLEKNPDEDFYLYYNSTPAYTCSVLITDYKAELSLDQLEFCKNIIIKYTKMFFSDEYQYQSKDGLIVAINTIPFLFELFPAEKTDYKIIFLLILFDISNIGSFNRACDSAINAIVNNLWNISYEDAQNIFLGFLKMGPTFNNFKEKIYIKSRGDFSCQKPKIHIHERFLSKYKTELEEAISSKNKYNEININQLDIHTLETAFQIIPIDSINDIHLDYIRTIIPVFCKELFLNKDNTDASLDLRFFRKFSYFLLMREKYTVEEFIQPFFDFVSNTRIMTTFFRELINAEDKVTRYEEFWLIWEHFYDKIINMCNDKTSNLSNLYISEMIHTYLLAGNYWHKEAKDWHTLKSREKVFYKRVCKDIGHYPCVLYSISKILNGIGSNFLNDGVFWISDIIKNNNISNPEQDTVYYIEVLVRKFIYLNRQKIKKDPKVKNKILVILEFLINKGSVSGYLLREDII